MVALAESPNTLQGSVVTKGWGKKKRVIWKKIDYANFEPFPELTENELRDLTTDIPIQMNILMKTDNMK